jgi:hypothetical protein
MTQCPICGLESDRSSVHAHLAGEHPEAVEVSSDEGSGRMRYRVACPQCEQAHEARVKPRSRDPEFLVRFAYEIRLVAFDMLLNHLEAEHGAPRSGAPAPPRSALPAAGPGGGRGRPGAEGVPMPPGMARPELPAWMEAAAPRPPRPELGDDDDAGARL